MRAKEYINGITELSNATLAFYPDFYDADISHKYFQLLRKQISWQSYKIQVFGKTYNQPRLTAFYNDSSTKYSYSKIELVTQPFIPILKRIKNQIEEQTGYFFNSVLANLYRDGLDSNGWHADNEPELGTNPAIASLSFGTDRFFYFKHNLLKEESYKINLKNGSLLVMAGEMQHYWKHQIPKSRKVLGERINLTFRNLKA